MPEIQYPTNPNSDTAFVVQEDGTKNRALMTAPQDTSTLELPSNSNSTKGYVTVDGKKQRVILTADIGAGGGGGSVDYAKTVQRAETMPTAAASNAGQQFLYSGESDATYTHGYIYENVASTTPASATGTQTTGSTLSDITVDGETFWEELEEYDIPQQTGDYAFTYNGGTGYWDYGDDYFDLSDFGVTYTGTPADGDVLTISVTAPSATYAWTRVDVQPAGATYTAGTGISIDANNEISVTAPTLTNTATQTTSLGVLGSTGNATHATSIGYGSSATNTGSVAIGRLATSSATGAIAIGRATKATANNAIQLGGYGSGGATNYDADTFKVGNANGNFEIMSADGTVPTARLTKVNTTATLAVADWSSNTQTVTVSGVKADSVVFVSPDPTSASDYASAGILCTAQAADSLTFTCTTTPTNAITVNVVCL